MGEKRSTLIDKLVIDTLISEKLEKVSHFPDLSHYNAEASLFHDSHLQSEVTLEEVQSDQRRILLNSAVQCEYKDNCLLPIEIYRSKEKSKGTILLQHGLFEENRGIYSVLRKGLNQRGFDVYLLTLPFHYRRAPHGSFSGEYFWSANIIRTRKAFKQAVYELFHSYTYIKSCVDTPLFLAGFSMGATVGMVAQSLWKELPKFFAINPASDMSGSIWKSPLCSTIKNDYITAGYEAEDLHKLYRSMDPLHQPIPETSSDKIHLAYGLYDLVTEQSQYRDLIERWNLTSVSEHKAGHLNTLRVPQLAQTMADFFESELNN